MSWPPSCCPAAELATRRGGPIQSDAPAGDGKRFFFVDVHDALCADCVLVHEPAQLDEEPLRVGLLQSRAVELLQALGGLLEAQAHATQELSDPSTPRRAACPGIGESVVIASWL